MRQANSNLPCRVNFQRISPDEKGVTWIANQAVGFGILRYPHTWNTAAWGITIGVGAMFATMLAVGIGSVLRPFGWLMAVPAAFAAAFAGYEITLYAATAVLSSSSGAPSSQWCFIS
jgi:hypothetical protein